MIVAIIYVPSQANSFQSREAALTESVLVIRLHPFFNLSKTCICICKCT